MSKEITGSAMLQAMKLWTPIIARCRKSLGNDVDDIDLGTSTDALVKLCMKTERLEKLLAAYKAEAEAAWKLRNTGPGPKYSQAQEEYGDARQAYDAARAERIKLEKGET